MSSGNSIYIFKTKYDYDMFLKKMNVLPEMGFAGLQVDPIGSMGYIGGVIAVAGVVLVVYRGEKPRENRIRA